MTIWETLGMVGQVAAHAHEETITINRRLDAAIVLRADGRMETYTPRSGEAADAIKTCAKFLASGTLRALASGIEQALDTLQAHPTAGAVFDEMVEASRDECDDDGCPIHGANPVKPDQFDRDGTPKAKA